MARWRLTNKHYLNVPGTEWEHKETDQQTGRQGRKIFTVPRFLNPEDPADWTDKANGEIVVCYEGKGQRFDLPFIGPPTPDMEPLDDEARAISDRERPKWIHPIESLPGDYSASLLASLERQVDELARSRPAAPAPAVSPNGVDPAEFAKLQEQVAALMARNAELEARPRRV